MYYFDAYSLSIAIYYVLLMIVWAKAWRTSGRARGLQRLDPPDLALGCPRPLPRVRTEGPGASHSGRRTWIWRTFSCTGRRSSRSGRTSASTGSPTCSCGTSHPVASQRPAGSETATATIAAVAPTWGEDSDRAFCSFFASSVGVLSSYL